ncbi:hypothetical protein SNEBB_002957 [Seison nebaliae]|nr:hypothetical protein SNEBB_002957 [Seison nebaliae]
MKVRLFAILSFALTLSRIRVFGLSNRNPVVLLPGDGGTQIWAKLNKPTAPHLFCEKKTSTFSQLWLNMEELAPYIIDCLVDNLKLVFHPKNGTTTNSPGVDILIKDFGKTSSVEYLDSFTHISLTAYFYPIVQHLVDKLGYVRDENIYGVPYDFRRAPNEMKNLFIALKFLVENAYELNNKLRIIFIAHSMGNVVLQNFLTSMNQRWKDKYVESFIALAPPWAGAVKAFRLYTSGDNLDMYVVRGLAVRPFQRTMPSTAYLMPSPEIFDKNSPFVRREIELNKWKNYTLSNLQELFNDINYTIGYNMYQTYAPILQPLNAPCVKMFILHGTDVPTPAGFQYDHSIKWPDDQPIEIDGDGDGTVNRISSEVYKRWKQRQPIKSKTFPGVTHMDILNDVNVMEYIDEVLR